MKTYSLFLLLIIIQSKIFSQNYDRQWLIGYDGYHLIDDIYFGFSSMDFSNKKLDLKFLFKGNDNIYGSLTYLNICDSQGNLALYYNGCAVYNKDFEVMPNGDTLNPGVIWDGFEGAYYPSQNSALVLPDLNDSNKYILVHKGLEEGGTRFFAYNFANILYYSIIDLSLDDGRGAVIKKNQVVQLDTLNESQTAACRHANGRDWWIPIRHGMRNTYYWYLLDPGGIRLHHTQSIGLDGPGLDETYSGNACFSPDGTKFASCLRSDFVQLFDFDRCTGLFSNPIHLTQDSVDYAVSVCFSPNSRFLYFNDIFRLWQYDIQSQDIKQSEELIAVWDTFVFRDIFPTLFFQTRLAPDNKIYMCMFGGTNVFLHRINYPNRKGKDCQFIQRDIRLPNRHSGTLPYFPNFKLGPVIGSICDSIYQVKIKEDLFIGPNPVKDELKIEFRKDYSFNIPMQFELYSTDGKLILNQSLHSITNQYRISLTGIPHGLYIFRLMSDTKEWTKTGKIIIIK